MHEMIDKWHEIILDFFENKKNVDIEKFKKTVLSDIEKKLKQEQYFGNDELKDIFTIKKKKDQCEVKDVDLWEKKIAALNVLEVTRSTFKPAEIEIKLLDKSNSIAEKWSPEVWINWALPVLNNVCFATHVAKLTHSSSKASSMIDIVGKTLPGLVTTSALNNIQLDGAVVGNQYAPVYQFLKLEQGGILLQQALKKMAQAILEPFSQNSEQIKTWVALVEDQCGEQKLTSHVLAKQVYFPIGDGQYHLLSHLKSSSLAQALKDTLFNEQQSITRQHSQNDTYSSEIACYYPGRAKIAVTASQHSNVSQLNGSRGGFLHLLSAKPPNWRADPILPVNVISLFQLKRCYLPLKNTFSELSHYLYRLDSLELSIKNPERAKKIQRHLLAISDHIFDLISEFQALPSGWSCHESVRLKLSHLCLLDPDRNDEVFLVERANTSWRKTIASDFAHWLNRQMHAAHSKLTPSKAHFRWWERYFAQEFLAFEKGVALDQDQIQQGQNL